MTIILVVAPRLAVQTLLEHLLTEQGHSVQGPPDLVLTCQRLTAWFWSRQDVPVAVYEKDETIGINEVMAVVEVLLQKP